jgi:hypothetical protein
MIMDDLMIMNDLEANSGVTSWSSFANDSCGLQPEHNRWSVRERSQAIEDRLPVLVAGKVVVGDEELANAGLSAIPGEGDIHAPILRLPLGRVVRCNGARLPEALSRQQVGIYTFRHEINHHARRPLARQVKIV